MGYNAKVGSFNIDTAKTAGQTQSVSGLGFQPKIVLFWWSGSTATGDEVAGGTYNKGFGAGISSSSRFSVDIYSLDASSTSKSGSTTLTDQVITTYTNSVGTVDGKADFDSLDSDGFTLKIDDQFTNSYRISYLALGGNDLTDVYIGNEAFPASSGEYDITDVGFQPEVVIIATTITNLDTFNTGQAKFSFGFATGLSNQGVITHFASGDEDTSNTKGYGYNAELHAGTGKYATDYRGNFVSFLSNGFRLNHEYTGTSFDYVYIALKGGQYLVGDITTRTDSNDIVETVGFQPVAILLASANRALSSHGNSSNNAISSIGAATSTSNRFVQANSDENGLADTETAHANYDSAVYANIADDAIVGLMDLKSIDANGFTAVMDDPDPSECWVTYLAIGATEEGGGDVEVVTVMEVNTVPVNVTVCITEEC